MLVVQTDKKLNLFIFLEMLFGSAYDILDNDLPRDKRVIGNKADKFGLIFDWWRVKSPSRRKLQGKC